MSVDLLRSLLLCVVIYAKKKRKKKLGLYSASSGLLLALPPRCWSRLSVIISNRQQVFAFVFLTHTHTHNKFPFSFFGGVGGKTCEAKTRRQRVNPLHVRFRVVREVGGEGCWLKATKPAWACPSSQSLSSSLPASRPNTWGKSEFFHRKLLGNICDGARDAAAAAPAVADTWK